MIEEMRRRARGVDPKQVNTDEIARLEGLMRSSSSVAEARRLHDEIASIRAAGWGDRPPSPRDDPAGLAAIEAERQQPGHDEAISDYVNKALAGLEPKRPGHGG